MKRFLPTPTRRGLLRGAAAGAGAVAFGGSSFSRVCAKRRPAPPAAQRTLTFIDGVAFQYASPLAVSAGGEIFVFAGGTWDRQGLYVSPTSSYSPTLLVDVTPDQVSHIRGATISPDCKTVGFYRVKFDGVNRIDTVGRFTSLTSLCSGAPSGTSVSECTVLGIDINGTVWHPRGGITPSYREPVLALELSTNNSEIIYGPSGIRVG